MLRNEQTTIIRHNGRIMLTAIVTVALYSETAHAATLVIKKTKVNATGANATAGGANMTNATAGGANMTK